MNIPQLRTCVVGFMLFAGLRADPALAFREYLPTASRFVQRDPLSTGLQTASKPLYVSEGGPTFPRTSRNQRICSAIRSMEHEFASQDESLPSAIQELALSLDCSDSIPMRQIELNSYNYLRNAPTVHSDPLGLDVDVDPWDWWSAVHCGFGFVGGWIFPCEVVNIIAIWWERWEPTHWPGWHETPKNQQNDIWIAVLCCEISRLL